MNDKKTIEVEVRVIGMEKAKAREFILDNGLTSRVISEDGKSFTGTCDYNLSRINLTIEENLVTKATRG